jgi:hypothetical protein
LKAIFIYQFSSFSSAILAQTIYLNEFNFKYLEILKDSYPYEFTNYFKSIPINLSARFLEKTYFPTSVGGAKTTLVIFTSFVLGRSTAFKVTVGFGDPGYHMKICLISILQFF